MSRRLFLCLMVCVGSITLYGEAPGVHRFANYNIRYVNANNGDTGDKLWANRRQYVTQIFTDYDFDIVGLEEVTGNNKDAVTGKSQLQDLQDLLPDYTMIAYEREDKQYSYGAIMYKTNKYECIAHNAFWISETPDVVSKGWTAEENIYRRCIWAHMRVRSTGEEFYFCQAHTNYGPTECGIEGAKLVSRILHEKAGQMPIVLVGDFNLQRSTHKEAYRGYASVFYDAALTVSAEQNYCLPTTNPSVTYTANNWIPAGQSGAAGSEFDYIFYDHMTPLSRHIITENYGRSVNPSDHYPLLVRFRLEKVDHPTSFNATDEVSLQRALKECTMGDTVCLTKGEWELTNPIQPECSIILKGGYNEDFTEVVGETVLRSKGYNGPIVDIPLYYSFAAEGVKFIGGGESSQNGGAVYSDGSSLAFKQCVFEDFYSAANGGAIAASCSDLTLEHCIFRNTKAQIGGAVYAKVYSNLLIRHCVFESDTAVSGAAVAVAAAKVVDCQYSSFHSCYATQQGALYIAPYNMMRMVSVLNCSFFDNTLEAKKGLASATKMYGGAGIYARMYNSEQVLNIGLSTFIGNHIFFSGAKENFNGAAVHIINAKTCLMDNIILANDCQIANEAIQYADVYADDNTSIWRNTYNLYSNSTEVNDWQAHITETFDGRFEKGVFTPTVSDSHVVNLLSDKLGNYDLKCLATTQRLCESAFMYDLNGDGSIGGYVNTDQLNRQRGIVSCIGALEYEEALDIPQSSSESLQVVRKHLHNGQLYLYCGNRCFSVSGKLVE
ncbi:MAG: endonuclease/exonuclease/phosphatase family protein [Paludibacteraceae bacterium]|nr:endonuclease/exonuclease/phosphatase family protein [Paludibacteraceae bacterium]